MTLVLLELYEALKSAGISDELATAAAHAVATGQPDMGDRLHAALKSAGVSDERADAAADAVMRVHFG